MQVYNFYHDNHFDFDTCGFSVAVGCLLYKQHQISDLICDSLNCTSKMHQRP